MFFMAYVVKQPNGLLAIYSQIISDFTAFALTPEQAIQTCVIAGGMNVDDARKSVDEAIEGKTVYFPGREHPGRWENVLADFERSHGANARKAREEEVLSAEVDPFEVPIEAARLFAQANSLRQVIIAAWDGTQSHIVTYGESESDSDQAAEGGNLIKRTLGWPESLQAESGKVLALRSELSKAYAKIAELENKVHGG